MTNVVGAMDALKPLEVIEALRRQGASRGTRHAARTPLTFVGRMVLLADAEVARRQPEVLFNEPMIRARATSRITARCCIATAARQRYVCDAYPQGLLWTQYYELTRLKPQIKA